jgi:hypothetical protein
MHLGQVIVHMPSHLEQIAISSLTHLIELPEKIVATQGFLLN